MPPLRATGAPVPLPSGAVELPTSEGTLTLTLIPQGARVTIGPAPSWDDGMLVAPVAPLPASLSVDGQVAVLEHGGTRLTVGLEGPLTLALDDRLRPPSDGHFVREHRLPPLAKCAEGWVFAFDLGSDEPVYGLGEKWDRLDRRGRLVTSLATDALGVNAEASYKNTPFAWSPGRGAGQGWGLFVHTAAPVSHGVGFPQWSNRSYAALVEAPHLDLFLLKGDDGAALIGAYTSLTGRAPVPPLWSLGVILSKAYYRTADELLATARAVRARRMPCDTITLDGRAWQDTDTRFAFEWDQSRYPYPGAVIAELKALGFKVCVWEYPLVSVNNPLFAELAAKGWLLKDRRTGDAYRYQWDMEPFGAVLTPLPDSGLLDFTHPDAFAFWREAHKPLFDLGIDMIKADFGEQVEPDTLSHDGRTGLALRNAYPLLYNRCVYEAAAKYAPSGPFLFSRSAWAGSQRYPAQWGGDPQADWEGLAADLRGGLSWGLSGGPFYATDIGGFYKDRRDEALYIRWTQAAIFSAHMRLHGIGPREPWSYGEQAERIVMDALRLRYRLIPYLRRATEQAAQTGLPVQRAMVLACPDDRAAWPFDTQFFCGDDLLVAPCLRADGVVDVYLPHGRWTRFLGDGDPVEGGRVLRLILALEEMAVFAREGVEIALGPEAETTAELAP